MTDSGNTDSGSDASNAGESGTEEWIEGPDENLERTVIAISLIEEMVRHKEDPDHPFDVIIDLNLTYHSGRQEAKEQVAQFLEEMKIESGRSRASDFTPQYYFATLTAQEIRSLAKADERSQDSERAIYNLEHQDFTTWDEKIGPAPLVDNDQMPGSRLPKEPPA